MNKKSNRLKKLFFNFKPNVMLNNKKIKDAYCHFNFFVILLYYEKIRYNKI